MTIAPLRIDTRFDELYICSTLKELAAVDQLDDRKIGGGPFGSALHTAFQELVRREVEQ